MPRSSFVNSFGFLCNGLIGLAATDELADADWRGCSPGEWNWMKEYHTLYHRQYDAINAWSIGHDRRVIEDGNKFRGWLKFLPIVKWVTDDGIDSRDWLKNSPNVKWVTVALLYNESTCAVPAAVAALQLLSPAAPCTHTVHVTEKLYIVEMSFEWQFVWCSNRKCSHQLYMYHDR